MNLKPHKSSDGSVKTDSNAKRSETELELDAVRKLANEINRGSDRFAFYEYLTAVYRLIRLWRRSGLDKVTVRRIARRLRLRRRKGTSPIRVIIDATFASADPKQKSRWVRALEFAAEEKTPAKELCELFRSKGGVAGCARAVARLDPKRTPTRDDWAPRPSRKIKPTNTTGVLTEPCRQSDPKHGSRKMDWFGTD
jgi:hypothetical protein